MALYRREHTTILQSPWLFVALNSPFNGEQKRVLSANKRHISLYAESARAGYHLCLLFSHVEHKIHLPFIFIIAKPLVPLLVFIQLLHIWTLIIFIQLNCLYILSVSLQTLYTVFMEIFDVK